MDVAMEQNINFKIFAFYGSDLEGYPDFFLECLYKKGYGLLALDVKSIEFASLHKLPYTIINDWLDTKTMLEIRDIAEGCEINWFKPVREEFTSNGVCWPEFDHVAMQSFWLDAITSLKLANFFRVCGIEELLIVKQKNPIPVVFNRGCDVCKILWENELADLIRIIESKGVPDNIIINNGDRNKFKYIIFKMNGFIYSLKKSPSLKSRLSIIINSTNKITSYILLQFQSSISRVYSSPENLTGKIAFLASGIELSRSNDILQDLITTFPKNVVIIPHQMSKSDANLTIKKWEIPIIKISEKWIVEPHVSKKFTKGYQDLIKISKGRVEDKIVSVLRFHFLYYCQYRWPMLNNFLNHYLNVFLRNPPKIIISAALNLAEWHIPILAAKRCGIKTISIPHGVVFGSGSVKGLFFDYDLYLNQISKEILQQIAGINENQLIPCKNCTDVNSHPTRVIKPKFSQNSWKILVLFAETTNLSLNINNSCIYPFRNPKIQMEAIKILSSPPEDLKEKISLKFKVHPTFSELELFNAVGEDFLNNVLPTDTQLEPVLDETDLVIGVNYHGSAFVHAIKNKKPMIFYYSDEFFENGLKKSKSLYELLSNNVTIVHTSDELWDLIRNFFTDPVVSAQMKSDVSLFSNQFLDNSSYPTIGNVIEELLRRNKEDDSVNNLL
jgi:hypothetical protein